MRGRERVRIEKRRKEFCFMIGEKDNNKIHILKQRSILLYPFIFPKEGQTHVTFVFVLSFRI